jgi:hypothetical protein
MLIVQFVQYLDVINVFLDTFLTVLFKLNVFYVEFKTALNAKINYKIFALLV